MADHVSRSSAKPNGDILNAERIDVGAGNGDDGETISQFFPFDVHE